MDNRAAVIAGSPFATLHPQSLVDIGGQNPQEIAGQARNGLVSKLIFGQLAALACHSERSEESHYTADSSPRSE